MTLEQRVRRAERMLVIMATSGRRTRSEWRYKINSLIHAQMMNEAEGREQKQRIDMLIQTQLETSEQIRSMQKETSEQMRSLQKETWEQIRSLAAGQAKTDEALRAFINSLRKGHNGRS
ncbi:MAG TPA: hypothetical protein VFY60_13710 [Pyrinomonadaceae bacterium]|nr:hypothetical protein [Pyrinomonadaceae bacterium]